MHLRRFVLVPLNELVPTLLHPTLHRSVNDLLEHVDDSSCVELWRPNKVSHSAG
jgi:7,8-dihydro-6-hydroxymethylpterin-pyrophosphokinase